MSISISSQNIKNFSSNINKERKVIILGEASSDYKNREIISPKNKEEALSIYGDSELYKAYCLLFDMGVTNIYTTNCFYESDYIRVIDKLIHYDFDFLVPIGIYLSDKFYNPIEDTNEYYITYFLRQFATVNSLTTVLMTERHASLFEDFDSYISAMTDIENELITSANIKQKSFLEKYGNNLNFVYNNVEDIPYSNILLAGLYCTRNYAEYFNGLNNINVVFNIDNIDVKGLRAMYFKYNFYINKVTLENPFNFKQPHDIYSNALIDDVIKITIKNVDISKYKGKLFTPYMLMQIKDDIIKSLNKLKGKLIRRFNVNKVVFKKTEEAAGYIIADYSIVPYGTVEDINIIMGAV